eukprot:6376745-Prymnesium_polylepis.4
MAPTEQLSFTVSHRIQSMSHAAAPGSAYRGGAHASHEACEAGLGTSPARQVSHCVAPRVAT